MLEQLAVNGVIAGSGYALMALSFGIIFGVTGTFHFAHGILFALAGYLFLQIADRWHVPVYLAAPIVMLIIALLGMAIEQYAYRPLRKAGASSLAVMLSSLGIALILQNLIVIAWGGVALVAKATGEAGRQGWILGDIAITPLQVVSLLIALLCWAALEWLMKATRSGQSMRALAQDPVMADLIGIDGQRVRLIVYGLGSAIAAVAGMLTIVDVGLQPSAGLSALLIAVIAVILGGIGSMTGAVVGALIIGLAQNLGVWKLPSEWQEAIAFGILIIVIFWRPTGLFAARAR